MQDLAAEKATEAGVWSDLARQWYMRIAEDQRAKTLVRLFEERELDDHLIRTVKNLVDYFEWCRGCRNTLMHAEHYPGGLFSDDEVLSLTKPFERGDPRSRSGDMGYLHMDLTTLRGIADRMRAGVVQAATIDIHLRCRNRPIGKVPAHLRPFVGEALPAMLDIPPKVELQQLP